MRKQAPKKKTTGVTETREGKGGGNSVQQVKGILSRGFEECSISYALKLKKKFEECLEEGNSF